MISIGSILELPKVLEPYFILTIVEGRGMNSVLWAQYCTKYYRIVLAQRQADRESTFHDGTTIDRRSNWNLKITFRLPAFSTFTVKRGQAQGILSQNARLREQTSKTNKSKVPTASNLPLWQHNSFSHMSNVNGQCERNTSALPVRQGKTRGPRLKPDFDMLAANGSPTRFQEIFWEISSCLCKIESKALIG